jgi:hypothetical protein
MGLLFVLIVWIIFFGILGLPIFFIAGFWSWRNSKRFGQPSKSRAVFASLLPFVWIVTGLVWFIIQGIFNEVVRGVDVGLGDGWQVPIRNRYYFCMIDVHDEGSLMKDGCTGVAPISGINKLSETDNFVVGTKTDSKAFSLNTQNGEIEDYRDITELKSRFPSLPPMKSTLEFYFDRRGGWQDLVVFKFLRILLFSVTYFWFRRFIRPRPRDRKNH